jgi:uncharacterized protein YhhL (DUF1145 family)
MTFWQPLDELLAWFEPWARYLNRVVYVLVALVALKGAYQTALVLGVLNAAGRLYWLGVRRLVKGNAAREGSLHLEGSN